MNDRRQLLDLWLQQAGYRDYRLQRASEDASFRSYLRLETATQSLIVMDAPPDQEPCDRFIAIAGTLRDAGLNAPEIIASNLEHGFLLLTDFGSRDYLSQLNSQSEAVLYADALAALLQMQLHADKTDLPDYDAAMLLRELDLFHDWFLLELLGIELDAAQQSLWLETRQILVDSALSQPQVFVHRDYHSRNLMVVEQNNPGILDFQDAVSGPITYDLVSLLRDCYIAWPRARVQQLVLGYYETARAHELVNTGAEQFMSWFNLMGIQRHLKVAGIFSRLKIRDGKARYLDDIPLTLDYLLQVCREEESTAGLCALLDQLDLPARVSALRGNRP
jgi:aminoglycoside/choline kinase family phosphotransferase